MTLYAPRTTEYRAWNYHRCHTPYSTDGCATRMSTPHPSKYNGTLKRTYDKTKILFRVTCIIPTGPTSASPRWDGHYSNQAAYSINILKISKWNCRYRTNNILRAHCARYVPYHHKLMLTFFNNFPYMLIFICIYFFLLIFF